MLGTNSGVTYMTVLNSQKRFIFLILMHLGSKANFGKHVNCTDIKFHFGVRICPFVIAYSRIPMEDHVQKTLFYVSVIKCLI